MTESSDFRTHRSQKWPTLFGSKWTVNNSKMVLCHKCSSGPSLNFIRNICVHSVLESNHYKVLGLTSSATQAEIKSAYYELSKIHHPDKNQGSEKSAKMFRDITAAYEVLGNEKSRKLYDREQSFRRPDTFQRTTYKSDYNDEYERYYYERKKRATKVYYGRTPHYDFDAWYRAHYVTPNQYSRARPGFSRGQYSYVNHKEGNTQVTPRKGALAFIFYFITVFSLIVLSTTPKKDKNLGSPFNPK